MPLVRVMDAYVQSPTGADPPNGYEVGANLTGVSDVIVGVSIRMKPGDITTLLLEGRRLDPQTKRLTGDVYVFPGGSAPHHALERRIDGNNLDNGPNRVITGLWARAQPGDITSMTLWKKTINAQGHLEGLAPVLTGYDPERGYEAHMILPAPFVVTGVGLRANPGDVTHLRGLFALLREQ